MHVSDDITTIGITGDISLPWSSLELLDELLERAKSLSVPFKSYRCFFFILTHLVFDKNVPLLIFFRAHFRTVGSLAARK